MMFWRCLVLILGILIQSLQTECEVKNKDLWIETRRPIKNRLKNSFDFNDSNSYQKFHPKSIENENFLIPSRFSGKNNFWKRKIKKHEPLVNHRGGFDILNGQEEFISREKQFPREKSISRVKVSSKGKPFSRDKSISRERHRPFRLVEFLSPSSNLLDFPRVQKRNAHKQTSGKVSLSGSSSSPVEPIKPLLNLGSSSSGGLTLPPHPVFDEAAPRNVTGLQDNTAYLHCLVHNLGNKSVSWIRQRDLHILTVDRYTYTTDQRYEVIHSEGSKDWILKIKYAQVRDSGKYECQLSTKPVKSYIVNLNIYAPKAEIIGAPDMHVDRGSTINLTCVIEHSPQPPAYIFWYHNGKVINYDSPRGGITVVTERGNTTRGYLLIQDARSGDSGNYSCEPSNTANTTLRVHVLDGEFPAAMQTSSCLQNFQHSFHIQNLLIFLLVLSNNLSEQIYMTLIL